MKKVLLAAVLASFFSISYATPYDLVHLKIVDAGSSNADVSCRVNSDMYGTPSKDLSNVELESGQKFEADILPANFGAKKLVTLNMSCSCNYLRDIMVFHLGNYSDDKVTAEWITHEPQDAPPPYLDGNMTYTSDANSTTVTETVTTCEAK